MAKTLQFRRGTTSELSSITGAEGELFVDTTKDTVVVMDGTTTGGFPLATETYVNMNTINESSQMVWSSPHTFSANVTLGIGTSLLANGGVGTNGQVLTAGPTGLTYWSTPAGSGNLSAVAEDITPSFSEVYDIGSTTARWYDAYLSNSVNINGAALTGAPGVLSTTDDVVVGSLLADNLLLTDNMITPDTTTVRDYTGSKGWMVVNGNLDVEGDLLQLPVAQTTIGYTNVTSDATFSVSPSASMLLAASNYVRISVYPTDNASLAAALSTGFVNPVTIQGFYPYFTGGDTTTAVGVRILSPLLAFQPMQAYYGSYVVDYGTGSLLEIKLLKQDIGTLFEFVDTAPGTAQALLDDAVLSGIDRNINYSTLSLTTPVTAAVPVDVPPITTGLPGSMRFNADTGTFEGCDGVQWKSIERINAAPEQVAYSSTGVDVDFSSSPLQVVGTLTDNVTFTGSGYTSGSSVTVKMINGSPTSGSLSVTFPTNWIFVGEKPVDIAYGKTAILTITSFGTTEDECVAAWAVQQ